MTYDLVVIGGGPAGVTAALRARELGKTVCLIERSALGGVCTNTGCVPMRALAKAAKLVREAKHSHAFGIETTVKVNFAAVMDVARRTIETIHQKKDLGAALKQAGVDTIVGEGSARFLSPTDLAVGDARRVSARNVLLAVGGHARRPELPGNEHLLLPTDIWSLRELPARLTILGTGATGLQAATCFHAFGSQVTLLETASVFAPGNDADVSIALREAFECRGVKVVTDIGSDPTAIRLELAGGTTSRRCHVKDHSHDADVVLAATGWPANLDGLNLEAAGVKTEKNAIVVDAFQRTTAPHIYVAGDADGKTMLVQAAFYEAILAVDNALADAKRECSSQVVPTGGFTDPPYASVGLTEDAARRKHGDDIFTGTAHYHELDRAVIDGATEGFAKLILRKSDHVLLGAHVVGEEATEIVQVAAAAMTVHTPIDGLARLQFSYPTYAALIGIAARRLSRKLGLETHWSELDTPPAEWERRHRR